MWKCTGLLSASAALSAVWWCCWVAPLVWLYKCATVCQTNTLHVLSVCIICSVRMIYDTVAEWVYKLASISQMNTLHALRVDGRGEQADDGLSKEICEVLETDKRNKNYTVFTFRCHSLHHCTYCSRLKVPFPQSSLWGSLFSWATVLWQFLDSTSSSFILCVFELTATDCSISALFIWF